MVVGVGGGKREWRSVRLRDASDRGTRKKRRTMARARERKIEGSETRVKHEGR